MTNPPGLYKLGHGNQKGTIQRNWQHSIHKTKTNKTKTQHNMRCTPLYVNKHKNTTQCVLDTTMRKQTQKHNTMCVRHHYT